jgi:hypothetical protein
MPTGAVRHIPNLAAGEWLDENGLTWLQSAPNISLLSLSDARETYSLTWDRQDKLFAELSIHLAANGALCCEHRVPSSGGLWTQVGV